MSEPTQLERTFDEAISLPPAARMSWLAALLRRDPRLAAALEPLLAARDAAIARDAAGPDPPLQSLPPGSLIAGFEVLHLIGGGAAAEG